MTKEINEVHRLMLKISRMKSDLDVRVFDIGVKLLSNEATVSNNRHIAHATAAITETGLDGNPRGSTRAFIGSGTTPEGALHEVYDFLRDAYPPPNPFPPIEETKEKIFEHPLNGSLRIDKIWIRPLSQGPHRMEVSATVLSSLGAAQYFGQELGTFGAVGQDEREALYWLLERLNKEFPQKLTPCTQCGRPQ